jgi:hypothetical protein
MLSFVLPTCMIEAANSYGHGIRRIRSKNQEELKGRLNNFAMAST